MHNKMCIFSRYHLLFLTLQRKTSLKGWNLSGVWNVKWHTLSLDLGSNVSCYRSILKTHSACVPFTPQSKQKSHVASRKSFVYEAVTHFPSLDSMAAIAIFHGIIESWGRKDFRHLPPQPSIWSIISLTIPATYHFTAIKNSFGHNEPILIINRPCARQYPRSPRRSEALQENPSRRISQSSWGSETHIQDTEPYPAVTVKCEAMLSGGEVPRRERRHAVWWFRKRLLISVIRWPRTSRFKRPYGPALFL